MHIALTSVIVVLTVLAIGAGARLREAGFRLYSIATILVVVGFGAVTGPHAQRRSEDPATRP